MGYRAGHAVGDPYDRLPQARHAQPPPWVWPGEPFPQPCRLHLWREYETPEWRRPVIQNIDLYGRTSLSNVDDAVNTSDLGLHGARGSGGPGQLPT